jgi:hypothetical protein
VSVDNVSLCQTVIYVSGFFGATTIQWRLLLARPSSPRPLSGTGPSFLVVGALLNLKYTVHVEPFQSAIAGMKSNPEILQAEPPKFGYSGIQTDRDAKQQQVGNNSGSTQTMPSMMKNLTDIINVLLIDEQ